LYGLCSSGKGYPVPGAVNKPDDLPHLGKLHELFSGRFGNKLYHRFRLVTGEPVRKAPVRQVRADEDQLSVLIVGYVATYVPATVASAYIDQFQLGVEVPLRELVRPDLRIRIMFYEKGCSGERHHPLQHGG